MTEGWGAGEQGAGGIGAVQQEWYSDLRSIPGWRLVTEDAQALYHQLGFTALRYPDRHMEKRIAEADR